MGIKTTTEYYCDFCRKQVKDGRYLNQVTIQRVDRLPRYDGIDGDWFGNIKLRNGLSLDCIKTYMCDDCMNHLIIEKRGKGYCEW